jgi:penicillin-binding protein 1C
MLPLSTGAVPLYQDVRRDYVKSDSLLLDRRGEPLHELRTDKDRRRLDWTLLADISPALKQAVIQAEDKNFYHHGGVDYPALGAALVQSLRPSNLRGASTITMQLAAFLDKDLQAKRSRKTWPQKWRQVGAAKDMEKRWTKAEILETYLNLVSFRGELQGVAAASRGFFGKAPHGLNQSEAVIMAALIRSPNATVEAVLQRSMAISRSLIWPVLEDDLKEKIRQVFLGGHFIERSIALAPHVAERLLKSRPKGSTIACTLDASLQRFVLDRLSQRLASLEGQHVCDGAVLVLHNKTGQVLAYVGYSTACSAAKYVDGVQAKRQAGSTLKPFLYSLALDERILTAASVLNDAPLDMAVPGGLYHPRSYDGTYRGPVSVRTALASSLNVPAVLTLKLVGMEPFLSRLRKLGIQGINESGDYYGPSLALGSADVTLWELTNAYRMLAQGGQWSPATLSFDKAKAGDHRRIVTEAAVFIISDILADREARSSTFGLENSLATRFWSAVKTGTSKDMRDNWCIGYSADYTVGVWVGNYSGESMWNVSGVSGAAPVWHEIMTYLHRLRAPGKMAVPKGVIRAAACTGQVEKQQAEWFIQGTEPPASDGALRQDAQRPYHEKIVYPPSGTVIALDPDIPSPLQRVFFLARTHEKERLWKLNESLMGDAGKTAAWQPVKGKHQLLLLDHRGTVLDAVNFEVRGAEDAYENQDREGGR